MLRVWLRLQKLMYLSVIATAIRKMYCYKYLLMLFVCHVTAESVLDSISETEQSCTIDGCPDDFINVVITFKNAVSNLQLQKKFTITVRSLLETTSANLNIHVLGDEADTELASEIINKQKFTQTVKITAWNTNEIAEKLHQLVEPLQRHFSTAKSYYDDSLFYLSVAIHRVLPETVNQIIMIDADLKFLSDIRQLHQLFTEFTDEQVIGIARDNQPVYRHMFHKYRNKNKGTLVGEPPPHGITGFNSGVMLLNVKEMRNSKLYNSLLNIETITRLTEKYDFKGHLGDQDFFTLLSIDYGELFYTLPCGWNRQLCKWWENKGYDDVFYQYYNCDEETHILHGNCNTPIPGETY